MSIIYCEKCDKHIDTDFDAEHEEECGNEFCGNCGHVLEKKDQKEEYDGYCQDCYENEIRGMKYG